MAKVAAGRLRSNLVTVFGEGGTRTGDDISNILLIGLSAVELYRTTGQLSLGVWINKYGTLKEKKKNINDTRVSWTNNRDTVNYDKCNFIRFAGSNCRENGRNVSN